MNRAVVRVKSCKASENEAEQGMAAHPQYKDWSVTDEKVAEAVRRIVKIADPSRVVLFGSRARGDHRSDSDLDLAVIIDAPEDELRRRLPHSVLRGIHMEVSLIAVSQEKYDLHRPWLNSVFNYIDREGVVLYDRHDQESTRQNAVRLGAGRRNGTEISCL
jgi:predicted nucleotidyltransferase